MLYFKNQTQINCKGLHIYRKSDRLDTRLEVDTNPLGIAGRASGVKVSQIKRCGATSCVEPL